MDNENLLQLEGAVENIVYRNEENGYTVIEISDGDDYITAVGIMPQANVGDTVKLTGDNFLRKSAKSADLPKAPIFSVIFLRAQSRESVHLLHKGSFPNLARLLLT